MTRGVWFQLVDEEGKVVTSADCVECADDAMVFKFRHAVKVNCPNTLTTVDAADLTVFADRAAFDAVNRQPLEEDLPIGSFGGSKKDALIVQVPPKPQYADPRLLELQESLLHLVLLDDVSSTSARSNIFKAKLSARYDCKMGNGKLRCMLLNTALPSQLVIGSHLFRHKLEKLVEKLMGFSDIDDGRNGLLLFKPLEHAFDHFQISFIYDQSTDEFRLKIFDRSVKSKRLFDVLDEKGRAILLQGQTLPRKWRSRGPRLAPGTNYDIQTTFGDLEGHALCFRSVERPYKRCLNLQARLARKTAIEKKWIKPEEDDFPDFWSEGMSLAEKMQFFHAKES